MLTRAKDKMGTVDWLGGQTEHCLMGGARQADPDADQPGDAATRASARTFAEAGRVLRPRGIALPCAALRRPVQPLPPQRQVGLPRR